MIETLKSRNGRRVAVVERAPANKDARWKVELSETRRFASSQRVRYAETKPEATEIARKWIGR